MYLLDTSILSEFTRLRPSPYVAARVRAQPASALATSSVCVMEMRHGAMRRVDAEVFWIRLQREVLGRVRVEPFDDAAARRAGDVLAELEAAGLNVGIADAQIGGTALARGLVLVTANVRHFRRIPRLVVEDWTRPQAP